MSNRKELISWWLTFATPNQTHAIQLLERYDCSYNALQYGGIGGACVKICNEGFELDPLGEFMILIPVWHDIPSLNNIVEDPDLIDVIAWHPSNPNQWFYLRGEKSLIAGAKSLFEANIFETPLFLHRTPLEWLKAGCKGAVLLDLGAIYKLLGIHKIFMTDILYAKTVRENLLRLALKDVPKFYVGSAEVR